MPRSGAANLPVSAGDSHCEESLREEPVAGEACSRRTRTGKRRERDSNPRSREFPTHRISNPALSATQPSLPMIDSIVILREYLRVRDLLQGAPAANIRSCWSAYKPIPIRLSGPRPRSDSLRERGFDQVANLLSGHLGCCSKLHPHRLPATAVWGDLTIRTKVRDFAQCHATRIGQNRQ